MNNYDDLQRFKDKTHTGSIDFKDMSAQNQHHESSHWAIIRQLNGDDDARTSLAQGGSVKLSVPQAVSIHEFDGGSVPHMEPSSPSPLTQTTSVKTEPDTPAGATILQHLQATSATTAAIPPVSSPSASVKTEPAAPRGINPLQHLDITTPAFTPVAPDAHVPTGNIAQAPTSSPAFFNQPAMIKTETGRPVQPPPPSVRFDKLFITKGSDDSRPAKDLPLQPLLEMIASCR